MFHRDRSANGIANPRLVRAMHDLAHKECSKNRVRLYSELLRATLVVPTPELSVPGGLWVADGKKSIQLIGIKRGDGIEVTPAFTDEEALRNWDPNTPSIGLNALDLFKLIVTLPFAEVMINPFDPIRKMIRPGGHVTRSEFEALAKGVLPVRSITALHPPAGARVSFEEESIAFLHTAKQRLLDALESFPEIESAFMLKISYPNQQPHRAIAIRTAGILSDQDQRLMAKTVVEIIEPCLSKTESFDVIPLTDAFYGDLIAMTHPFYSRSRHDS